VFGIVLIVPATVTPDAGAAAGVTEVITGAFCLRLAPPSPSFTSLAVGPSSPRSIASPPLEKN